VKKHTIIWGLVLIVVGYVLFRYVTFHVYPESIAYARAGHLKTWWDGLTVGQKLFLTATEAPMYAGILVLVIGLVRLVTGKRAVDETGSSNSIRP
jgi:hypothetical protein